MSSSRSDLDTAAAGTSSGEKRPVGDGELPSSFTADQLVLIGHLISARLEKTGAIPRDPPEHLTEGPSTATPPESGVAPSLPSTSSSSAEAAPGNIVGEQL